MVGRTITLSRAIEELNNTPTLDETSLKDFLNRLTRALRQCDVNSDLVHQFRSKIHKLIYPNYLTDRPTIRQIVSRELCKLLDHEIFPCTGLKRDETNVVMFVGFQGSGKTTACARFASYYMSRGWCPALICADMYTPGARAKLKKESEKDRIRFNGSMVKQCPGRYAKDTVNDCKDEQLFDLIVVDTSGLFEDMTKVYEAIRPDLVMLVIDGSIGQGARDHVQAFERSFNVGGVIVTKMDSCKGIGALSAIATTESRVAFTSASPFGELEPFYDVKLFVSRLLSGSDLSVEKFVTGGDYNLRTMYGQLENLLEKEGPLPKRLEPVVRHPKVKLYMAIMELMTSEEMDSSDPRMTKSRAISIARELGCEVIDVEDMFNDYDRLSHESWNKIKGLDSLEKAKDVQRYIPPRVLNAYGGLVRVQSLVK